jgi:hypothetical protein
MQKNVRTLRTRVFTPPVDDNLLFLLVNHIFDVPDTSRTTNSAEDSLMQDEQLPENREIHVASDDAPAAQGPADGSVP